jgi:hypothetical protein
MWKAISSWVVSTWILWCLIYCINLNIFCNWHTPLPGSMAGVVQTRCLIPTFQIWITCLFMEQTWHELSMASMTLPYDDLLVDFDDRNISHMRRIGSQQTPSFRCFILQLFCRIDVEQFLQDSWWSIPQTNGVHFLYLPNKNWSVDSVLAVWNTGIIWLNKFSRQKLIMLWQMNSR